MNLIQQSVQQITRENLKNYYDTEQAEDELPVVLTYHPEHLLNKPSDKAKTWQDLLLARSLI